MMTEYDSAEFNERLINYAKSKDVNLFVDINPRDLSAKYFIKKGFLETSFTVEFDLFVNTGQIIYRKLIDAIDLIDQASSKQLHSS